MEHSSFVGLALALVALTATAGQAQERPERPQPTQAPGGSEGRQGGAEDGPGREAEKRGVTASAEGADGGYTLFTPLRSTTTYLVDAAGETVHTWPSAFTPGNSAYLLEDGCILRCAKDGGDAPFSGGGEGGRIQKIAADGTLVWDFPMASEKWRQHHDVAPMPNGNVLAIVWEGVTPAEAMAAGRDEAQTPEAGMWPDAVIELKPNGEGGADVVWEWHAWDHLVQDRDPAKPHFGKPSEHLGRVDVNFDVLERPKTPEEIAKEEAVARRLRALGYSGDDEDEEEDAPGRGREPKSDWMHTNSVDYDAAHDLIAISVRSASEVWILDHSTTTQEARGTEGGRRGRGGDILYRFGRPRSHGSKGKQQLFNQHDARFVHVGDGLHLTVFNNGSGRPGGDRSSVDEFALPFSASGGFTAPKDGALAPASVVWTWNGGDEELYNGHISGAQRLANGSTLMCLGEEGRTIEVSAAGEILWDWSQPFAAPRGEGRRGERGGRGPRGERGERPDGPPPADGGRPPRGEGPPPEGRRGPPPGRGGEGRGPGGPGERGGPGGRRGGGGPQSEFAVFRVTRYGADDAGVTALLKD